MSILPAFRYSLLLLSLSCGFSTSQSRAAETLADSAELVAPLQAGQRAPSFVVRSVDNAAFAFDPGALAKPVVIITFRGGWCPYCNLHLSELHTVIPQIRDLGIDILFLSGDRPELLYASLQQETRADIAALDYRIYSDADMQAGLALGIAFRAAAATIERRIEKGQDIGASSMMQHHALSVPAVFAIDKTGVIRFSFAAPDYKIRLPADTLLTVARELVQ